MSGPRILQLVSNDEPGGVRTLVETVEAGLAGRGFETATLSLGTEGSLWIRMAHLVSVARCILAGRFDAILCYQGAASVFGCALAWLARVEIRTAHQTALPHAIRPLWRGLDRLFGTMGVYTHIVANSAATRAAFDRYGPTYRERFVDIFHGVAPLPVEGKTDWRGRFGIGKRAMLLAASGRLTDQKDHATAIRALTHLPDAHLAIAGDGPDLAALLALAERLGVGGRFHAIGVIAREDLGDLLGASDIYLFPSVWETFGIAGVEAAMAGLPVVASDLPVLREVLGTLEPRLVRFHKVGDARHLANEVVALAARCPSLAERQELARATRARWGVAAMIARYDALISGHPPIGP